jgi:uncharacterized NAD-dependent epimerase/dehydratase family protein
VNRRFVILAEGRFDKENAKTATGAIRYIPDQIVAVIDSATAGQTAQEVVGFGGNIPVVPTLAAALELNPPPDALLIGIAPPGGGLPASWRPLLARTLEAGLSIWSGLHTAIGNDPELRCLADEHGAQIHDLRMPPADLAIGTGAARHTDAYRVLTVGMDCNVGKMTVSLEIRRELRKRGVRATFGGTGQTGILIDGHGIAVDAVVADFISGAAERLTLEAARDADVVLVEGQGSLLHPSYSGVTLGLMHGSMPDAMILCWMPGRPFIYGGRYDWVELPSIEEGVRLHETAMSWVSPAERSRVVALAANTHNMAEVDARRAIAAAAESTGLPAADPIRFGADPLVDAVMAAAGL